MTTPSPITHATVHPGDARLGHHAAVRVTLAGVVVLDGLPLSWGRDGRLSLAWPAMATVRPVSPATDAAILDALGVPARYRS